MWGRIPVVIDRRPTANVAAFLSLPPTVRGALWRGLWSFWLPRACAMLTACPDSAPIAEVFVADASESVRRRQVFMTTPASFSSALADLRSWPQGPIVASCLHVLQVWRAALSCPRCGSEDRTGALDPTSAERITAAIIS